MAITFTPRSVGLIVSAALAAGWLGASVTQQPTPAQSTPRPVAKRAEPRVCLPPRNCARGWRNRRCRAAEETLSFTERAPRPSIRDHQQHGDEGVAPPPPAPSVPPPPVFKLSGIASNTENGVAVLTAIVIDNGLMVFVKAGDRLSNGYSVVTHRRNVGDDRRCVRCDANDKAALVLRAYGLRAYGDISGPLARWPASPLAATPLIQHPPRAPRFAITSSTATKAWRRAPRRRLFRRRRVQAVGHRSNTENGVAVLTAIVNDNGSMVFVKAGDKLSNGYSVVRIDEVVGDARRCVRRDANDQAAVQGLNGLEDPEL